LTTNRIAERAGVSIGSLYQYFPGRDAILASLIREMRRSMLQDFQTAVSQQQQQSLDAEIEALVSAALKHHFNNPTLARWLEKAEEDLPLDAQTQELKQEMAKFDACGYASGSEQH